MASQGDYPCFVPQHFRLILRIIGQPKIDSRREAQEGQDLLLKRRERRDMTLREVRSTNNRQGYFVESFQQAFSGGLAGPTFRIASKQSGKLLFLF
jgi:hypothetical protein